MTLTLPATPAPGQQHHRLDARWRPSPTENPLEGARRRFQSTPPPDPTRIVYPLRADQVEDAQRGAERRQGPHVTPLTREDAIPESLCRAFCAPGPRDPRLARDYLGSLQWTAPFARYLSTATPPWWRQAYVVMQLAKHDPRALRLVQLANEVAEATGAPLITVVPQVAPHLGMRARPAWLLYLRTEQIVQRVYRVRTSRAA